MPKSPMGWQRLNAHIGVTQEGKAIIVNDPLDMIWHAQGGKKRTGLSRSTIGIEIEGNYPGIRGDMRTLWKGGGGPHELNIQMMEALSWVFRWLSGWFADRDLKWSKVYGHRQSKNTRIADPGEEIWKAVGIPWIQEIGADDGGNDYCRGSGRPIPREWDPRRTSKYYK